MKDLANVRRLHDIRMWNLSICRSRLVSFRESCVVVLDTFKLSDRVQHWGLTSRLSSFGFSPSFHSLSLYSSVGSQVFIIDEGSTFLFPYSQWYPAGVWPVFKALPTSNVTPFLQLITKCILHSWAEDSALHSSTFLKSFPSSLVWSTSDPWHVPYKLRFRQDF